MPLSIKTEARGLLVLGLPLIINNLLTLAVQVADTVMAGRLSAQDLAAIALGGSLWMIGFLFGLGVLIAVNPKVARFFGAGDYGPIGQLGREGLLLSFFVALLVAGILTLSLELLRWVQPEPEVERLTRDYLFAMAWGLPAVYGFQALRGISEGMGHTIPTMVVGVIALPINITGNVIFMYGHLGFPAMGAVGCGVSSAMTFWLMFIGMGIYISLAKTYHNIGLWKPGLSISFKGVRGILALGTPIGLAMLLEVTLFSAAGLLMAKLGTVTVAAHQIALNYAGLMFMVPLGLSMAATVRVAHAMGSDNPDQARCVAKAGLGMSVIFMSLSALVIVIAGEKIVSAYTTDLAVAELALSLLYMAAIFQFSDGLQVAASGALRGYHDTFIPMIINGLAYWLVGFTLAWILGLMLGFGPIGIWSGLIAGLSVAAILLGWRLYFRVRNPYI